MELIIYEIVDNFSTQDVITIELLFTSFHSFLPIQDIAIGNLTQPQTIIQHLLSSNKKKSARAKQLHVLDSARVVVSLLTVQMEGRVGEQNVPERLEREP